MEPKHDSLIATDIERYLHIHETKSLLRVITCGSVDDGKSTLIGRLLYESKMVFSDHLEALDRDSFRYGTQGNELDLALLVDGLSAEREQGITIDVAYRFFNTDLRKFIVADTPGHEQYTRNMVTGASTADAAIVMVDARKGLLTQSRRHSFIVRLLGVRHVLVAVNKLDLVDYSQDVFEEIRNDYTEFAQSIGLSDVQFVPISALRGDNVVSQSERTPWYTGPPLLSCLEEIEAATPAVDEPFRFNVQGACRPDSEFRGVYGQVTRGRVKTDSQVAILPSGTTASVARIVTMDGDLEEAVQGDSVTLTLNADVDVSFGDMIVAANNPPQTTERLEASVVWMAEVPLERDRRYVLKLGSKAVQCRIDRIISKVDVNTLEREAADTLTMNDIGICVLATEEPISCDTYEACRATGGFILIDRMTNDTVAAGMISAHAAGGSNLHWQTTSVTRADRENLKSQKGTVIWFTGISGAGKSTISSELERALADRGNHTYMLDGDNVRQGLCSDLGFTRSERDENVRRLGEVSALMADAGLLVMTCAISPSRDQRERVRKLVGDENFVEVYVKTSIMTAEQRDPKGLYAKARAGAITDFTGLDAPYEEPLSPDLTIDTEQISPTEAATRVHDLLVMKGRI